MPISFKQLGQQGRLGNSLFQAAATISLAISNDDDYILPHCDLKHFFNIPKKKFINRNQIKPIKTYEEPFFHYIPIPYRPNQDLIGYFQSQKYFNHCRAEIKKLFTIKAPKAKPMSGVTAIHVRRGDYTKPHLAGCFNVLGMDYYHQAMNIIKSKKYLIVSDDIAWCKKHFVGPKFIISEGNSPISDLELIMNSSNIIGANSSFSWWGSWLNKNNNKKAIFPKKWFGPKLNPTHNTKDLIPKKWMII